MSVGIAIPVFNEEGAVEQVLHQTMFVLRQHKIPFFLAVVNNGSTDQTGAIIDTLSHEFSEIIPIHFDKNQGYGGGILAGMRALEPKNLDVIGWSWGDGQVSPEVLPKLYKACIGEADLAKTRRVKRKDGISRLIQSKVYNRIMTTLGTHTEDINGCPKLFCSTVWKSIDVLSHDWFIDAEVILLAEEQQWTIHQESITMEPRYYNQSKVNIATVLEFIGNIAKWKLKRKTV